MRGRLRIGQHPLHLRVEHRRRAQLPALGQREQLVVRHRVPEEVAQPRRQLDVRDRCTWSDRSGSDRARCGTGSAARRASPGSRARCPARPTARRPSPARRTSSAPRLPRRVTGRRYARRASVRQDPVDARRRPSSDRRPGSSCGSASRPLDANGPTTVIEPIHLLTVSL